MTMRRSAGALTVVMLTFMVLALALGLTWFARLWGGYARAYELSLSAGSRAGLRHEFAEILARCAAPERLRLALHATAGSEDALQRLEAGELDLALVQGGFRAERFANIRLITALHVEPLHLLVRQELLAGATQSLAALRGHSVNIGPLGSGTHDLALAVLMFAGLDEADTRIEVRRYDELLALPTAQLPDAIFTVSSLPSPFVRELVVRHGYQLAPLPFGEAFALAGLQDEARAGVPSPQDAPPPIVATKPSAGLTTPAAPSRAAPPGHVGEDKDMDVDRVHIYETVIPAFTYAVDPPVPPTETRTLGARLLLVARTGVPPPAVERLLHVIYTSGYTAHLTRPPLEPATLDLPPEFPLHPGAERYRDRNKSLITSDVYDTFEKTINILAILGTTALSVWLALRRRWKRRRQIGFAGYMKRVTEIERRALELEQAAELKLRELLDLQHKLSQLKVEALERLAGGDLDADDLTTSFLAQVNDARSYLTRLILHERDNLEAAAVEGNKSLRELWERARRTE